MPRDVDRDDGFDLCNEVPRKERDEEVEKARTEATVHKAKRQNFMIDERAKERSLG